VQDDEHSRRTERADGAPFVTVAVCTLNRADLLRRALEGLARQTAPADSFEVLVVDNGSTDRTPQVAEDYAGRLPLRYLREERAGLSHARNAAWRAAAGDYVAYLDDDAVPESGWLEAVQDQVRRHAPDVLTGPHRPDFVAPRPAWFPDDYERWNLGDEPRELRPDEHAIGVNLICRRDALAGVGGFRADLGMQRGRLGFGEEVELQERIRRHVRGARLRYCPEAAVRHAVRAEQMTLGWQLRRCVRYGLQAGAFHGREAFGGGRLRALAYGIGHGFAAALNLLRCPLRGRRRHPHWRRFLLDAVLPHVRAALAYVGFALRSAARRRQRR
jgi:GT2 family glycosyltransferase